MHLLMTFRVKGSLETLIVTCYARPVTANSEAMPVPNKAGQLQAESLALDMHETHSSISIHRTSTEYSSLFCYFKPFIFLVHVDEVTIQHT